MMLLPRLARPALLAVLAAGAPVAGAAHPHIFIQTALTLVIDETGHATGVEVRWAYDELYTMLTFEDLRLDSDYDGELTAEELQFLDGFDLNWIEGFEGDLYLTAGEVSVRLGAPEGRGVKVHNGQIVTTHFRPLAEPVTAEGLVLRAYDPTFYTAYDLSGGVTVTGGCAAQVTPANLDRAYSLVEELLYATPADQVEDAFPEVGEAFADTVVIRCAG